MGGYLSQKTFYAFLCNDSLSIMLFFLKKTKQKNINLPADIDIFIYLIKIDYVGVKRVATGVL